MLAQFQLARCYQALQQSEKAKQHYAIVYTHTVTTPTRLPLHDLLPCEAAMHA